MVVMAELRRLYRGAFSCNCFVSASLPSISFVLAAGESGDLGVLEGQKGPGIYQFHPARCQLFTSQVFMECLQCRGSEQSPSAVGWTLG